MTIAITRRTGLSLMAGAGLATLTGPLVAAAPPGIAAVAARGGRRFGSAFAYGAPGADRGSFANPRYAALLERDCGLLVPENELKWQHLQPTPAPADFTQVDAMLAWAERHSLPMRGHNLLWHQPKWMPRWTETQDYGAHPATAAAKLLTDHITTVMTRYGTRIRGYDVVNEAVDPGTGTLYETALSRAIGGAIPTLDLAFRTARAAQPGAQLVYNDYMSWEPHNGAHRAGVLTLLEGFRRRGVPVDALGIQSHIVTQGRDAAADVRALDGDWRRFLDAVTAMGYGLLVTELDVRDNGLPADPALRDAAVAAYAGGYLDVMLAYPALSDILVWGMSDRYSWIEGFDPRKDGARRRPCPYDAAFRAKPMRDAILAAFAAAPAAPIAARTAR